MNKIYESDIEQLAIKLLVDLGYKYAHGSSIAPDGESA